MVQLIAISSVRGIVEQEFDLSRSGVVRILYQLLFVGITFNIKSNVNRPS